MRSEEEARAHKLIFESKILSSVEKAEWLQLLPQMNDKQILELVKILLPDQNPSSPSSSAQAKPLISMVHLDEKEIGSTKPEFELELPAQAKPAAKPAPAPGDPFVLQKKVEQMAKTSPAKPAAPVAPPASMPPAPASNPAKPLAQATQKPPATPIPQAPISHTAPLPTPQRDTQHTPKALSLTSVDDFSKITAGAIHGGNPKVLDVMMEIAKKQRSYAALTSFERSPLYNTYVTMGISLLNDPNPDRDAAYQRVVQYYMKNNQEYLTKEEFEVMTDLRTEIDKVLY